MDEGEAMRRHGDGVGSGCCPPIQIRLWGGSDEREGLRGREDEGGGPAAAGVAREAAASEPSPFSIQIGIDGGWRRDVREWEGASGEWGRLGFRWVRG